MKLRDFAKGNGRDWTHIFSGEELAQNHINSLKSSINHGHIPLLVSDVDLIVFGSIARNECTSKSDVDWTLLIDGQANVDHPEFANFIRHKIDEINIPQPTTGGAFGQVTYSHELVHNIGGEEDTNRNITRRILLLLESYRISPSGTSPNQLTAYGRIVRAVIEQYIKNDSGFYSDRVSESKVPRFLLNDIVRYWRTMCVDFAYKQKEQQGQKWALRNIKLRMSRKLIFVKGLLMCYRSYKKDWDVDTIRNMLINGVSMQPLSYILDVLLESSASEKNIVQLYDAYNKFLSMLSDDDFRISLEEMGMRDVYKKEDFIEARKISDDFQQALTGIFFEEGTLLKEFTIKYGIF